MDEQNVVGLEARKQARKERVEKARTRSILDVAEGLNMELIKSGNDYRWKEHDSLVITPNKNVWKWFSRDQGGDAIALVEMIKEVNFNQAVDYLNDGAFQEFIGNNEIIENFSYYLKPYEQEFLEGRDYLKNQRSLSDETISFFHDQGVLAQANAKLNNSIEPVIVFKTLSSSGEVVGATLQGINENREKWPERGYAKSIIRNSEAYNGMHVDIGKPNRLVFTESPIDLMSYYEVHQNELNDVRLVSMNGLKESTVGRHLSELEAELSNRPLNWSTEELGKGLDIALEKGYFNNIQNEGKITFAIDNDGAGIEFLNKMKAKGIIFIEDLPPLQPEQSKTDWNDYLRTSRQKKAPEIQAQKKERTNGSSGSLQDNPEGSPTPASQSETFERSVTSRPTLSSHLLNFSIREDFKSSGRGSYRYISPADLDKLNRRSAIIQEGANFYLKELANSTISYITSEGKIVQVQFKEENFMHLTGIKPLGHNQTAEKTLHDFAKGNGNFDNIMLSRGDGAFSKLNVLPDLPVTLSLDAFYFDNLNDINRYSGRFDSLIKSDDKDIMLLFRATEKDGILPVSVWEAREIHINELNQAKKNEIIAIYREREGRLEQIAINDYFIQDQGKELQTILAEKQFNNINATDKTESFTAINDYHVKVSQAQKLGVRQFESGENISYQEFVSSLYKINQENDNEHLRISFNIYDPDGQLIKDNVNYIVGEETEPVSRLLGLGYARLKGQPELAKIDEKVLSQLEELKVNEELSLEANELSKRQLIAEEDNSTSDINHSYKTAKQSVKESLAQKVEQIVERESQSQTIEELPFDYNTASAYDLSEKAIQNIRDYTDSPEKLEEYLNFMSQFPKLSPRNVALVQAQWPGANAVATFNQWKEIGSQLGITPDDVTITKNTYTNKKTGKTREVINDSLSVAAGEKSKIRLFRPQLVKMIPVLDSDGKQLINSKGNPKFKSLSEATPEEKEKIANGTLQVRQFQDRDPKTGQGKFTTYKVFELSQTNLKADSYPKAMPNRQFDFNMDKVKAKEVFDGLSHYAEQLGVPMELDHTNSLGNAKGAFFPGEQHILLNSKNTPGEQIATAIHELAHASLHNPKLIKGSQQLPTSVKEFEAEMSSYLVSKHFGLDTSKEAISYMANWTNNLKNLDDKGLQNAMKRVHKTVSTIVTSVEKKTSTAKSPGLKQEKSVNFSQPLKRGIKL
ncbi:TPA: toprim domain-containing protein [Streptococcus agalactiae]|nr:toprim domain-containing protein [Streptococcus agalactiae]